MKRMYTSREVQEYDTASYDSRQGGWEVGVAGLAALHEL